MNELEGRLFEAVKTGDVGRIRLIIGDFGNNKRGLKELLNKPDHDGFRVLHRACAHGELEIMKLLLDNGADPNATDGCSDTPLHWACFCGNIEAVDVLLRGNADPLKPSSDGKTPLDAALEEKHSHVLQMLFAQPKVFNLRAVLESVLLEGMLYIKGSSRSLGRRSWKYHNVLLSSMVRSLFIWKGKDQTNEYDDTVHFEFQDFIAVRNVAQTSRRYEGRRINLYVRVSNPSVLNFQVGSSGWDAEDDGDVMFGPDGTEREEAPSSKKKNDQKKKSASSSNGAKSPTSPKSASSTRASRLAELFKNRLSFRSSKNTSGGSTKSINSTNSGNSSSKKGANLIQRVKSGYFDASTLESHVMCVSFLAETTKDAVKWVEALKFAGMVGKTMAAVRIQTCFRGYRARGILNKHLFFLNKGSRIAQRRGRPENDKFYVPLEATVTAPVKNRRKIPPPEEQQKHNQLIKRPAANNYFRSAASTVIKKATLGKVDIKPKKPFNYASLSYKKKTTALSVPIPIYHTGEDTQGYLSKQSSSSRVSGTIGVWKRRYFVISYHKGELQYYDPSMRNKEKRVRRIPFSRILRVVPFDYTTERSLRRFRVELSTGKAMNLEAKDEDDAKRWVTAIERILPRENVAAVAIQRVIRGYIARSTMRKITSALIKARQKRMKEIAQRIELARQRAVRESETRMAKEELELLSHAAEEERLWRERRHNEAKARKKKQDEGAIVSSSQGSSKLFVREYGIWQEFFDESRGRLFYFNSESHERTWKPPAAIVDQLVPYVPERGLSPKNLDRAGQSFSPLPRYSSTSGGEDSDQLPPGWEKIFDEASKQYYYTNADTGESTWTKPSISLEEDLTTTTKPEDWQLRKDANSDRPYYYHEGLNITRWELPDFSQKQASTNTTSATIIADNSIEMDSKHEKEKLEDQQQQQVEKNKAKDKKRRKPVGIDVGDGWLKYTDAKSGDSFYVNSATGEKSWTLPTTITLPTKEKEVEEETKTIPKSKKSPWEIAKTDDGQVYYFNSETNETSWTLPAGEVIDNTTTATKKGTITTETRNDDDDNSLIEKEFRIHVESILGITISPGTLIESCRSGVIFCRLFCKIFPGVIDERAINNLNAVDILPETISALPEDARKRLRSSIEENHALVIRALERQGTASVSNMPQSPVDIEALMGGIAMMEENSKISVEENRNAILDILWVLLRCHLLSSFFSFLESSPKSSPFIHLASHMKLATIDEFIATNDLQKLESWIMYHLDSYFSNQASSNGVYVNYTSLFTAAVIGVVTYRVLAASNNHDDVLLLPPKVTRSIIIDRVNTEAISSEDKQEVYEYANTNLDLLESKLYRKSLRTENYTSSSDHDGVDERVFIGVFCSVFHLDHGLPFEAIPELPFKHELSESESRDKLGFTTWMAVSFNIRVRNFFSDFSDGVVLCKILDKITNNNGSVNWSKVHERPVESNKHRMENASYVIQVLDQTMGIQIEDLTASSIVEEDSQVLLRLLWRLIKSYSLITIEKAMRATYKITEENVIRWANTKVRLTSSSLASAEAQEQQNSVKFEPDLLKRNSSSSLAQDTSPTRPARSSLRLSSTRTRRSSFATPIEIESFSSEVMRNSIFLLQLLDSLKPGIVNWGLVVPQSKIDSTSMITNAQYAVSVGMKLKLHVYLDWKDIVELKSRALFVLFAHLMAMDLKSIPNSS